MRDGRRETSFLSSNNSLSLSFSLTCRQSLFLLSVVRVYDGKRVVLTADGGDAAHQLSRGMNKRERGPAAAPEFV